MVFFSFNSINSHSHEFTLSLVKLVYVILTCILLYILTKYYVRGEISYQYMVLFILGAWGGLFVMSLTNILYMLVMLDAISMVTVALVAVSGPSTSRCVNYALHYYLLSAITSLVGYGGAFIWYNVFNTVDISVITFIGRITDDSGALFDSSAFIVGGIMLLVKFIFLLGLFPFQQYVLEITSTANYGLVFYLLVVSKLPVVVLALTLMKAL